MNELSEALREAGHTEIAAALERKALGHAASGIPAARRHHLKHPAPTRCPGLGRVFGGGALGSGLLPQPHGFEGLGRLAVDDQPNDPPIPQRVHGCRAVHDLDAAAPSTRSDPMDDHHSISRIDEPLRIEGELLPGVPDLGERPNQALIAVVARRVEDPARLVDVHLRIAELGEIRRHPPEAGQVPEKALMSLLDDLHVLLRHRLPSISPSRENA
jgi:hypothetical protein